MRGPGIISEPASYTGPRILAGVTAVPLSLYCLLAIAGQLGHGLDPIGLMLGSFTGIAAALCWWFAFRGHVPEVRARIRLVLRWGMVAGSIGFAIGFFGPILVKPSANQGPLVGIFVTGPLGFVLGIAGGWLYSRYRSRLQT